MPKLHSDVIELNQQRIEDAALRVFTKKGYHGTSIREIAEEAGVSIGNLYNYYEGKEAIFGSLVERYEQRIEALRRKAFADIGNLFDQAELAKLALGIREIVYGNPDFWRLMYIDVIEFGSRHFAQTFRSFATTLQARIGDRLQASTRSGDWNGLDPALAFSAIYLQLFTYFLVEKLFGGKQHLGMPDEQAVAQLIRMSTEGLWRGGAAGSPGQWSEHEENGQHLAMRAGAGVGGGRADGNHGADLRTDPGSGRSRRRRRKGDAQQR